MRVCSSTRSTLTIFPKWNEWHWAIDEQLAKNTNYECIKSKSLTGEYYIYFLTTHFFFAKRKPFNTLTYQAEYTRHHLKICRIFFFAWPNFHLISELDLNSPKIPHFTLYLPFNWNEFHTVLIGFWQQCAQMLSPHISHCVVHRLCISLGQYSAAICNKINSWFKMLIYLN